MEDLINYLTDKSALLNVLLVYIVIQLKNIKKHFQDLEDKVNEIEIKLNNHVADYKRHRDE